MRIPICGFDAKTGILCSRCESKLRTGQIGEPDVEVSKALVQLNGRFSDLDRVVLLKALKVEGNYVLQVEEAGLTAFRDNPELVTELERSLRGRVWFAGPLVSNRKFVEDILYPLKVSVFSTIWLPDGGRVAKVMVPGRVSGRSARQVDLVKKMVRETRGIDLIVESEIEAQPTVTTIEP